MNIPAPQLSKMMNLMTNLCDLLYKVLGKEVERDIDIRITEMMSDLNEIKGLMERYTKAMEALVPATSSVQALSETQADLKAQLAAQSEDIRWLRQQMSQPLFQE